MTKLKNPIGRSTEEWIGKSADTWPPPAAVQLRVLIRQDGKCSITGHKFAPGDAKQLDHIIALADWTGEGHGNREGNLQWILDVLAHKPKTAAENSARAPVTQRAKTHNGIGREKQPIPSDPHALRSRARPAHEGRAPVPPREMFVSLGEAASDILARITPRKDAAE